MIKRVFLTTKFFQQYGWLGEGVAQALFNVWHSGNIFDVQPDIVLLAEGESAQFIETLRVPKIFVSNKWEDKADDCVPPDLDWLLASMRAQINFYQKHAGLDYYISRALHNGLLDEESISSAPANVLAFADDDDRALLEIQLHDHHHVCDPLTMSIPEAIVVKDDLQKLSDIASHAEADSIPVFFWSEDREKILTALNAGIDSYITDLPQAEPRLTHKIHQYRKYFLREKQLGSTLDMAAKDSLTGLYNHRCLTKHLPALLNDLSNRTSGKLAAISFDLDRFKQVNDNWGHSTGDAILQNVAALLQQEMREGDNLYRLGGDEFLALVQHISTMEETYTLAERLCALIAETFFVVGEEVVPLTISAGVALYQKGERPQSLLQRADEALYRAKNLGRNRAA